MKVITFSRFFPKGHPKASLPTFFVEKIWQGLNSFPLMSDEIATPDPRLEEHLKNHYTKFYDPKWHTIRGGSRWKVGDWFSPRIWSGKPYRSQQIQFSLPIQIKKIWDFEMDLNGVYSINGKYWMEDHECAELALNDGLTVEDMMYWFMPNFNKPKVFKGQILSWSEEIEYS